MEVEVSSVEEVRAVGGKKALQRRLGNTAVGPSSARRMGPRGTIAAARAFLIGLKLEKYQVTSETQFRRILNRETRAFLKRLSEKARHWGAARKWLNIFLRDAAYNRFLFDHYRLRKLERWLEVPLDSQVAKGLRKEKGGDRLPRWETVIGLTPEVSREYQEFAALVAKRKGTCRVHLDLKYWRAPGK
jgi:hypothetical protein